MKYTREEVLQYVQEEEVAFIHLTFCDVFGQQKNISIVPSELSRAFEYGIAFDAYLRVNEYNLVHSFPFIL